VLEHAIGLSLLPVIRAGLQNPLHLRLRLRLRLLLLRSLRHVLPSS